jgi:hypothetical protein
MESTDLESTVAELAQRLETIEEETSLQRRLLLRLEAERREEARAKQWVFSIPAEHEALRTELQKLAQEWKTKRPIKGPHPLGPMHHGQSYVFQDMLENRFQNVKDKLSKHEIEEAKKALEHVADWFDANEHGDIKTSYMRNFNPMGRKDRVPAGDWLWIVRFENATNRGRQLQESTAEVSAGYAILDIDVRQYIANPDDLVRRLQRLGIQE